MKMYKDRTAIYDYNIVGLRLRAAVPPYNNYVTALNVSVM